MFLEVIITSICKKKRHHFQVPFLFVSSPPDSSPCSYRPTRGCCAATITSTSDGSFAQSCNAQAAISSALNHLLQCGQGALLMEWRVEDRPVEHSANSCSAPTFDRSGKSPTNLQISVSISGNLIPWTNRCSRYSARSRRFSSNSTPDRVLRAQTRGKPQPARSAFCWYPRQHRERRT